MTGDTLSQKLHKSAYLQRDMADRQHVSAWSQLPSPAEGASIHLHELPARRSTEMNVKKAALRLRSLRRLLETGVILGLVPRI
ncbi:hypothetical protein KX729_10075 [Rhizobium sp. XQZ8]|uniref:hypothetical protein n=1 Tax=Rhizobium populisoli TaxID=2859785 RepID=UPI001CA48FC1|nr:hypothetical protein [Rhizobium populisoli]MBW6421789.1 hypothetical protein [Rhizobium populisoli]